MAKKDDPKTKLAEDATLEDTDLIVVKQQYQYDGILIDGNINWSYIVKDLIERGKNATAIARMANCSIYLIHDLVKGRFDELDFNTGAQILSMHEHTFMQFYRHPLI